MLTVHAHSHKHFQHLLRWVCYSVVYLLWQVLLAALRLRPDNVDPADGALEELQRVIKYALVGVLFIYLCVEMAIHEEIMKWCESQVGITYFGLSQIPG